MALLQRIRSGLLLTEDFSGPSLNATVWTASPSDPVRFDFSANPGRLTIRPDNTTGTPAMLMMDAPEADFVFEAKGSFVPSIVGDEAGVAAFQAEQEEAALMQYYNADSGSVTYSHLRLQRKGSVYMGWGSSDGGQSWTMIGALEKDFPLVGLLLRTPVTQTITAPYVVESVQVYKDTQITIHNCTPGLQYALVEGGIYERIAVTCQENETEIVMNLVNFPAPFEGVLEVRDSNGTILETTPLMQIWGGDQFWYGLRLQVSCDTVVLTEDSEYSFGMMSAGLISSKIQVRNSEMSPANNVVVTVENVPGTIGADWVTLAEDRAGIAGDYETSLFFDVINPGETVTMWLRIERPALVLPHFDGVQYGFRLNFKTG